VLLTLELLLVILFTVAGSFWPPLYAAAALLSTAGLLARRGRPFTPLDPPLILLLLALPLSLWASPQLAQTTLQILRLLAGVAIYNTILSMEMRLRRISIERILLVLLAAGLLLSLASPFIVQWNALKLGLPSAGLYAPFRLQVADPVNPNVMAGLLAPLLLLALGRLVFDWRSLSRLERALAFAFVLLAGTILLLTQSRGGWLGLLAGLAVLLFLAGRRGRWILLAGSLIAILLVARLGLAPLAAALAGSPGLGGLEGRLEVWSRALSMIHDFPFTGIGLGSFTLVSDRLYPFFSYLPSTVEHAHNLYLQVAVDLGLPGLAAWLGLAAGGLYCAGRAFRQARLSASPSLAGAAAGLLAAQAAFLAHGLIDAVLWGMVRTAPLVWLIWGLSAALHLHFFSAKRRPQGERDAPALAG
jgi:putative inorganic carbon (HCO3(-)) transporter